MLFLLFLFLFFLFFLLLSSSFFFFLFSFLFFLLFFFLFFLLFLFSFSFSFSFSFFYWLFCYCRAAYLFTTLKKKTVQIVYGIQSIKPLSSSSSNKQWENRKNPPRGMPWFVFVGLFWLFVWWLLYSRHGVGRSGVSRPHR